MRLTIIAILILAMAGLAVAGGAGQSDTTYFTNYISSFHARVISYSPNLWRLDADTSEIRTAFNDAMLEVSKFAGAAERKDTTVMDSSLWFALPSDFQSIVRVAYNDPSGPGEVGLDSIALNDIGKGTKVSTDHPQFYTVWNRQIYFDRNNYQLDSMFIYYNAYAAKLTTDSTISNISKRYYNIVVDQAILNFYSGRVGAAVPQILALADRRLEAEYAKMNMPYKSIIPDVR